MALETGVIKQEFVCIDTKTNVILNELCKYPISIKYVTYEKEDVKNYKILYIKFNKKHTAHIIGILSSVKNKILLTGFRDYDDKSDEILSSLFGDTKDGIIEVP